MINDDDNDNDNDIEMVKVVEVLWEEELEILPKTMRYIQRNK